MIALDSFLSWVPNLKIEMISWPLTTLDVIQSLLSVPILRLSASLLLPLSICSMLISLTQLLILTVTKLSAPSNRLIKKQLPSIQQIDRKATAILESLPFFLPTNFILYLKKYCADCINLTCSSTQQTDTIPYVAFHRVKPQFVQSPSPLWYCVFNQTHRRTTSYSCIQAEFEHPPRFKGLHRCQSRIQSPPSRQ